MDVDLSDPGPSDPYNLTKLKNDSHILEYVHKFGPILRNLALFKDGRRPGDVRTLFFITF
jgi:hypothetical protein